MTISRRFFLKSTCGAVVAVAASNVLLNQFINGGSSAKTLVHNILLERFPELDLRTAEVEKFIDALVSRDVRQVGVSGASTQMALDDQQSPMTLDRYVVREFVMNTNYFYLKHSKSKQAIKYIPFKKLEA